MYEAAKDEKSADADNDGDKKKDDKGTVEGEVVDDKDGNEK
jgi:hypothetical protein